MATHRSRYGWMALGGLLCLFGLVLVCKLRDGNRALAQSEPTVPQAVVPIPEPPKAEEPPRAMPPVNPATPPPPPPEIQPAVAAVPAPAEPTPPTPATPPPPAAASPILIPASATIPPAPPEVPPVPSASSQPLPPITPDKTEVKAPPPPPAPAAPTVPTVIPVSSPPPPAPAPEPKPIVVQDPPSEPPLAPTPGPVVQYKVHAANETFKSLARKTLGSPERWSDIHKLNPNYRAEAILPLGTTLRLPGDACVTEEGESVKPLPTLRSRVVPKAKAVLPLTGTFPVTLDDRKVMTLPRTILEQLGNCDTVLLSPGSDKCLWLTNQAHLDRLQAKLDKSPARESEVRGFKRLYYAQTVKATVKDGRILLSDKLAAFAGLEAEVVLVGIDDHFEVWDAARWRRYTQTKKAPATDE